MTQQTRLENFTIRPAVATDVPVILGFIRELAEYEKLLHEVVATEQALREQLFGERPAAEVVIGEWHGKPVTFALFFGNFSTFLALPGIYLEDLYVTPAMRGKGIGKAMLTYLAWLARQRGCGRLEWSVLDWNEPALQFYRSIGAVPMDEWTVQRLTGDALETLARESGR
jgi:GNAT superfamily N-acetyltransferase